jgi:GTPase SAR1 family protein
MNRVQKVKDAVSVGKTSLAIDILKEVCIETKDVFNINQVVLIEARYNNIRSNKIEGVLSEDSHRKQVNILHENILEFCDSLAREFLSNQLIESRENKNSEKQSNPNATSSASNNSVYIALAGHANVGKTTLMRNIFRSEVGIVGDASNVTASHYSEEKSELGVTFIDCPGFNEAGRILDLYEVLGFGLPFKEALYKKDLAEDYSAVEGIKMADAIYYVVSVEKVPDKGDNSAMSLVRAINSNIIGVINMAHTLGLKNYKQSRDRVEQWREQFENNNIPYVIEYDFFWDRPTKIHNLFQETNRFIPKEKKEAFKASLNLLITNYKKGCEEVAIAIFNMLKQCRSISYQIVLETESDHDKRDEKIKMIGEKMQQEVWGAFQAIIHKIRELFNIKIEKQSFQEDYSVGENTLKSGATKKAEGMAGTAAIGAGWGFLKAAATLGAVSMGAGLLVGAIGGLLIGLFSKGERATTKLDIKLGAKEMSDILEKAISLLWAASNQGYGMGDKLDESKIQELIAGQCQVLLKNEGLIPLPSNDTELLQKLHLIVQKIAMPKENLKD